MSVVAGKKSEDGPKVKRTNTNSILSTPVKHTGELPEKKSGGRKSRLTPIVVQLKADPGMWYKIASGLKGTVSQTRVRMLDLAKRTGDNIEVETRATDEKNADCYARFIAPTK